MVAMHRRHFRAYLGSAILIQLPGGAVEALVGMMVLATGINAVLSPGEPKAQRPRLSPLVTGATGFIGSHLTTALVAAGVRVRALLRPRSASGREHLP